MLLKEKIEIEYELLPSRKLLYRVIKLDKNNFNAKDRMAYTAN